MDDAIVSCPGPAYQNGSAHVTAQPGKSDRRQMPRIDWIDVACFGRADRLGASQMIHQINVYQLPICPSAKQSLPPRFLGACVPRYRENPRYMSGKKLHPEIYRGEHSPPFRYEHDIRNLPPQVGSNTHRTVQARLGCLPVCVFSQYFTRITAPQTRNMHHRVSRWSPPSSPMTRWVG